jgi:Protein of unknown function (DUF4232)
MAAIGVVAVAGCADPTVFRADPAGEVVAPTSSAAPATPSCPAGGGAVTAGPVDAALGARAVTLFLVNCGSDPYAVQGYPGIGLLDEEHEQIAVQVLEEPDPIGNGAPGPEPLTLAPGEQARAVLLWRNTVELGLENSPGSFVAVIPAPGNEEHLVELDVDLGTTGRLAVGP